MGVNPDAIHISAFAIPNIATKFGMPKQSKLLPTFFADSIDFEGLLQSSLNLALSRIFSAY